MFSVHCCEKNEGGLMDMYCLTGGAKRWSSVRKFSRVCTNNTLIDPDNGRATEELFSVERPGADAHRDILQSNASWSGPVYQLEKCQPINYDDFTGNLVGSFNILNSRDPLVYPVTDSHGSGWTIQATPSHTKMATMDLQRSDAVLTLEFAWPSGFGTLITSAIGRRGIAFRVRDADNYLRVGWKKTSTTTTLVLEQVVGGVASDLASTPGFPHDLVVKCVGESVSVWWNPARYTNGTPADIVITNSQFKNETKHGIFRYMAPPNADDTTNGQFLKITAQDYNSKYFLSVYDASGPSIIAQHEHPLISGSGSICSGSKGLYFPVAVTPRISPYDPNGLYSGGMPTVRFHPGGYSIGTFTIPQVIPPIEMNPSSILKIDGTQIDLWKGYHPTDQLLENNIYLSRQMEGFDVCPTLGMHSYPMGAGYKLRSRTGDDQPITYQHALVVGELDDSDMAAAPKLNETQSLYEWTTTFTGAYYAGSMNYPHNFTTYQSSPGARTTGQNACVFFEGTPDGSAFYTEFYSTNGIFKAFMGGGGTSAEYADYTTGTLTTSVRAVNGVGGAKIGMTRIFQSGTCAFSIFSTDGSLLYEVTNGVGTGTSIVCASDRFFYITGAGFPANFSTALGSPLINGVPAVSNIWMISHDGSIRYPCLAVPKGSSVYVQRNTNETNGGAPISGFLYGDCIKTSGEYAPPLENPDFSAPP